MLISFGSGAHFGAETLAEVRHDDYGHNTDGEAGHDIDMSSPNIAKPMSMGHLLFNSYWKF